MVKSVWVGLLTVLSLVLVGFAAGGETSVAASAPDASPAGLVRVIENNGPGNAVVGFELDLHPDDWEAAGNRVQSELAIAPYGNLTEWAVFVFDETGELKDMTISVPSRGLNFPLGGSYERPAPMYETRVWLYEDEPISYRVVVALTGSGGVAMAPSPEWNELPTAEELLAMPSATPMAIGVGTGFSVEGHSDSTFAAGLYTQRTEGTPLVLYNQPLPSTLPGPLLDVTTVTEASAGWSYFTAGYVGYEAQGTWAARIDADESYEFDGLVLQHREGAYIYLAESLVFGSPAFYGVGTSSAPVSLAFGVDVANADYYEGYGLRHVGLGASLQHLIGVAGPDLTVRAFEGLIGLVPLPSQEVRGNDLVTTIGDVEVTWLGAAPVGLAAESDA